MCLQREGIVLGISVEKGLSVSMSNVKAALISSAG